jgi:hypothetical protein
VTRAYQRQDVCDWQSTWSVSGPIGLTLLGVARHLCRMAGGDAAPKWGSSTIASEKCS